MVKKIWWIWYILKKKKIDKYEFLTGKGILLLGQRKVIEETKFACSQFEKVFEKQTKINKGQGKKQVGALKVLKPEVDLGIFPNNMRTDEIRNETYKIKIWEEKIKEQDLKYKTRNCKYDFQQYETIWSFGESIYAGKISIHEAKRDQSNLLQNIVRFTNKSRRKTKKGIDKTLNTFDRANVHYEGWELTLNTFRSRVFSIKNQEKGLKILTPKQML